jgi:hypothetical protein
MDSMDLAHGSFSSICLPFASSVVINLCRFRMPLFSGHCHLHEPLFADSRSGRELTRLSQAHVCCLAGAVPV